MITVAFLATAQLSLICQGSAAVDHDTTIAIPGGLIVANGTATVEDSVGIKIAGDGTGAARLPRRMLPAVKTANVNGWFPLIHVTQGEDEITGQVRLNQYNKPRIRIDRITGSVRIDGPTGDFSGQCQSTDNSARKF